MIHAWRPDTSGGFVAATVDVPSLTDDQLLVQVEAAVLGAPELRATDTTRTPGGAAVGVVSGAGDGATAMVGQRVIVGPLSPCGECDVCRRGGAATCPSGSRLGRDADGTLASAVVTRARWSTPLVAGLELPGPAAALVGREAADAYAMYARAGIAPGEPVVVYGDDPTARFLISIAIAKGTRPMVVVDTLEASWTDWLETTGAIPIAAGDDLRSRVAAAAAQASHGRNPWRIFETSATAAGRRRAADLAGPAATVVLLAPIARAESADDAWDPTPLLDLGCAVLGVAGAHPDLVAEVAALAVRGEIDLAGAAECMSMACLPEAAARQRLANPGTTVVVEQ